MTKRTMPPAILKSETNTLILKYDIENLLKKLEVAADDKMPLTVNNVLKKGPLVDIELLCIKKGGVFVWHAIACHLAGITVGTQ